jgi:release factor glutamine methyltransferase
MADSTMYQNIFQAYQFFKESGSEHPLGETLKLIELISGGAIAQESKKLSLDLASLLEKRKEGMPLEYCVGRAIFLHRPFRVSTDTLIPRADTELLVQVLISLTRKEKGLGKDLIVIDLGTGCGNIAISFALEMRSARVIATDISSSAIEVAKKNAEQHGVDDRITFLCGDLFHPFEDMGLENKVDVIAFNPPYISTQKVKSLAPEIINYEPVIALDGGAYGIRFFTAVIREALNLLAVGGMLAFEIGTGQDRLVTALFQRNAGYKDIRQYSNDHGEVRVITAVKA